MYVASFALLSYIIFAIAVVVLRVLLLFGGYVRNKSQ